ncbi:hypothetical protein ABTE85_20170, partial [Acinetobacter baumannii]
GAGGEAAGEANGATGAVDPACSAPGAGATCASPALDKAMATHATASHAGTARRILIRGLRRSRASYSPTIVLTRLLNESLPLAGCLEVRSGL